jgi:3'-phosphoadenosine 5'-phosphosulfate sulfotransferase (PAPS reductase)/FAD synthetase
VHSLTADEASALLAMDGFKNFAELAAQLGCDESRLRRLFDRFHREKLVGLLEDWNLCGWSPAGRTYVSGHPCDPWVPGNLQPVALLPPCDPWFLFETEYAWVRDRLRELTGLPIDDDRLLLGNNGVSGGKFFWQIIYEGEVVLHVAFNGPEPADWAVRLTDRTFAVDWERPSEGRQAQILRCIEANRDRLDRLQADAVAFIDEVCSYWRTKPLLYFSGGKESVVMLALLEKAEREANLVFVGTGLDFPEDAAFLLEVLKPRIDAHPLFHLETAIEDTDLFRRTLNEVGRLDARGAWCREKVKVPLKARAVERLYGDSHFIAFEGSRWYENDFRRTHPRVNFAEGYERQIWTHPLAAWSGLDIWMYIFDRQLPVNPMYARGYQRTTCWMCPIVNPFHLWISRRQYPELWRKIDPGVELRAFDGANHLSTRF